MTETENLQKAWQFIHEDRPGMALDLIHDSLMQHKDGAAVLRTLDAKVFKRPAVPPELLSMYGVCIALVENRAQRGIMFCKMAIEMDRFQAELYLNLESIYLKSQQKSKAIQTLRKGLKNTGSDTLIIAELARLGIRRPPPITFLPRGNFINKYLGMFLYRRKQAREAKMKAKKK